MYILVWILYIISTTVKYSHFHGNLPFNSLYRSFKTSAYLSTSSSVFPSISEAILLISFRPYFSHALVKVLKSFRLHDENPYVHQIPELKLKIQICIKA
jgi:hypothetical protein